MSEEKKQEMWTNPGYVFTKGLKYYIDHPEELINSLNVILTEDAEFEVLPNEKPKQLPTPERIIANTDGK